MAKVFDGKGTTMAWTTSSSFVVEKTRIKPPGSEVNDIDITHLGNTNVRTMTPSQLSTITAVTFDGHHDPALTVPIGVNDTITVTFPDGSTLVFWGYLQNYEPGDIVEGAKMECSGTITISNRNASGVETKPAYAPFTPAT